jgi:hypothetical protein
MIKLKRAFKKIIIIRVLHRKEFYGVGHTILAL